MINIGIHLNCVIVANKGKQNSILICIHKFYVIKVQAFLWEKTAFLPARRYASAGNSDRNVSVRLSVCLSRAGIVSKRRKLAAWFLHHLVAPRL